MPQALVPAPAGADAIDPSVLGALAEAATEGLAIVDADGCVRWLNPAGARIIGRGADELVGEVLPCLLADDDGEQGEPGRRLEVSRQQAGDLTFVSFRDVTDRVRQERQFGAFVATATAAATSFDQRSVLAEVANSVLEATGQASCTLVMFDPDTRGVLDVGTAGGYPDDYAERLMKCVRRGAPLASLQAFGSQEPFVAMDWSDRVLADHRWAPVHEVLRQQNWGSLVAVPLTCRGVSRGSMTLFYRKGQDPQREDVEFLSTIAEVASVAIDNHQLVLKLTRDSALEERYRIARELHDSVSQTMFSMALQARALELVNQQGDSRRDALGPGLRDLHDLANQALSDMRQLIFHLRPSALTDDGLLGALRRHGSSLAAANGYTFDLESYAEAVALPESLELEVLRIVQEGLQNAARHARARHVQLSVDQHDGGLRIVLSDDGIGFDPDAEHPGHFGLTTMRERAAGIGATLTITSGHEGTQLVLVTPPNDPAQEATT